MIDIKQADVRENIRFSLSKNHSFQDAKTVVL